MDRPELLVDIVEVAMMSGPSCPSASSQQYLWSWCAKHIFCLPVSNAIAERQFNIGSIYLSHNESEESKQASHLFVENVLHSDRDGEDRVTSHHKEQMRERLARYTSTVTREKIKQAQGNLASRKASSSTAGRTLTTEEVHRQALQRHPSRPAHAEDVATLQESGRKHSVIFIPTRKGDAASAQTKSIVSASTSTDAIEAPPAATAEAEVEEIQS
eukprot:scpid71423/ scgid1655/ 